MKINKDFMAAARCARLGISKSLYRRQHESAAIVGACIMAAIILIFIALRIN